MNPCLAKKCHHDGCYDDCRARKEYAMNKDQEEKLVELALNEMQGMGRVRDKLRKIIRMVLELTEKEDGMGDENLVESAANFIRCHIDQSMSYQDRARQIIQLVREHDKPEGCETWWVAVRDIGNKDYMQASYVYRDKAAAEAGLGSLAGVPEHKVYPVPIPKPLTEREKAIKYLREKSPGLDPDLRAAVEEVLRMVKGEKS